MESTRRTAAVLLALLAIGGLAACGDDGETTEGTAAATTETTEASAGGDSTGESKPAAPAVPTIVVRDGAPVGGVEELEFNAGDQIRFKVKSNEADEVHVHGYDIEKEVPAGGTAKLSFPAELEGIYEVELHHSGEQIAELRVNP